MAVGVVGIRGLDFNRFLKRVVFWIMPALVTIFLILYGIMAGIYYENLLVLVGLMIAVGLIFALFLTVYYLDEIYRCVAWKIFSISKEQAELRGHSLYVHPALIVWSVLIPPSLIFALSSFVLPQRSEGTVLILGERSTLSQTIIARPFLDDIKNFRWFQYVTTSVEGVTADGVKVRATLKAALVRVDEEALVIDFAKRSIKPNQDVRALLHAWFNREFANFVATKRHTELQDTLALEYGTIANVTDKALERLAVRWDGDVRITDLHPSFKGSHIRPVG